MNWNEWEFIWRRQQAPEGATADINHLRETFEAKHRTLARSLLVRDVSEASAGVFAAAVLGAFGWHMGKAGWPFIIVVALILGVSGFFVLERIRARRNPVDPAASVLDRVEADLVQLRRQRKLLMSVALWYISPLFVAEIIVLATVAGRAKPRELQRDPVFLGLFVVLLLLINSWAWFLNRSAVRKRIDPRLAELEKLRDDLRSGA